MRCPPLWLARLAFVVLVISACAPPDSAKVAKSMVPRDLHPSIKAAEVRPFVSANNAFGLDLYRSLRSEDGTNLVFSPYSISVALAMTYAGARGETAAQMARALHFDLPQDSLHPAFNRLDLMVTSPRQAPEKEVTAWELKVANSIWADQTLSLLQTYLDLIAVNYGAGIRLADFMDHAEAARQAINRWVSDQTHSKITDLVPEGVIDTTTRMVLVNAIYFQGDWLYPFDPADTRSGPFTRPDGSKVEAQFMSAQLSAAPYTQGADYEAIELGYVGGTVAMDVIVPNAGKFEDFERHLDGARLEAITRALQPTSVALDLPKFRYSSRFSLADQLSRLGMPDAFDANAADFSGMTGGRDLFISKVLHQAFVAVDEKGTEAAAATSVIMSPTSIRATQAKLTIDRPFIYLIRDLGSGQILFLGCVLDPTK